MNHKMWVLEMTVGNQHVPNAYCVPGSVPGETHLFVLFNIYETLGSSYHILLTLIEDGSGD